MRCIRCGVIALLLLTMSHAARAQARTLRSENDKVQFENRGVHLTGWLEMPPGARSVPVVILVGGNNASWHAYDWIFRVMADSLLKRNIGVFYYDHRGDHLSEGSWAFATYEDLADDAAAAAEAIATRPGVDARRIGVWGHSMGGWIAPLAAARSSRFAFVITASGPGVSPLVQTSYDHMWQDINRGVPKHDAIEMGALRHDLWAYYTTPVERLRVKAQGTLDWARTRPWFAEVSDWQELRGVTDVVPGPQVVTSARFDSALAELRRDAAYDPVAALQQIDVPMLALFGGADQVVPVDVSIAAMKSAFAVSGNSQLTTHVFPGANHSLLNGTARDASSFAPGYLPMLAQWINATPPRAARAEAPLPRVYETNVTLGNSTCPDARVESHPTTVRIDGSTITLSHAGQAYNGVITADHRFTTTPKVLDAGGTRYRLTVKGAVTETTLSADVTVEQQTVAGAAVCSYVVHWSGRR